MLRDLSDLEWNEGPRSPAMANLLPSWNRGKRVATVLGDQQETKATWAAEKKAWSVRGSGGEEDGRFGCRMLTG